MITIILVIAALLFDFFVPPYLMVTAVGLTSWFYPNKRVWWLAAGMGLVFDVLMVRPLGLTSMVLVAMSAGVAILRFQLEPAKGAVPVAAVMVGEVLMRLYLQEPISSLAVAGQGLLAGTGWWLIMRMGAREGVYLKK